MDALIDAAKMANRTDAELTTLTAVKTQLGDSAAKGDSAELNRAAAAMATAETHILTHVKASLADRRSVSRSSSNAVSDNDGMRQLQNGKNDLDAKLGPRRMPNKASTIHAVR